MDQKTTGELMQLLSSAKNISDLNNTLTHLQT